MFGVCWQRDGGMGESQCLVGVGREMEAVGSTVCRKSSGKLVQSKNCYILYVYVHCVRTGFTCANTLWTGVCWQMVSKNVNVVFVVNRIVNRIIRVYGASCVRCVPVYM